MKKLIDFCILFALYVYNNYIIEDWSFNTKLGKIYYYPFWFIRSCLVWLICPLFIPEYFFKQSKIYKEIKKVQNTPEYKSQMMKFMNTKF
jgi:hypothetical protein